MQGKKRDSQEKSRQLVYLLRCWQETNGSWRYAVEPVDGRSLPRRGFSHKPALLNHLNEILPNDDD
ncbi:MAG: hypothetical protein KC419_10410 [Anaerolineales bacterium]|nr:hypothetical protein [Anaerolineales bacterium]